MNTMFVLAGTDDIWEVVDRAISLHEMNSEQFDAGLGITTDDQAEILGMVSHVMSNPNEGGVLLHRDDKGEIAGMAVLRIHNSRGLITHLWVRQDFRNKGIGHALVLDSVNYLKSMGVYAVNAGVAERHNVMHNLLTKAGFRRITATYQFDWEK